MATKKPGFFRQGKVSGPGKKAGFLTVPQLFVLYTDKKTVSKKGCCKKLIII
ncbi:Uncharacterized protein dnm_048320 [Desulfonema magnum]|uniref:Uncharacterized protein n=1 Tax=Desulfonema magnum TaxID=45655 RepID=A0A975GPG9_9BACT|nr:Uncharacterized protein dnm_048320 [Desulfonema magnum]